MQNICIFCKKSIKEINNEHIVPEAILGDPSQTENVLVIKDVCKNCNSQMGQGVDSEFLNLDEVKALRLLHKDFLHKGKNPKLKLTNIITLIIENRKIACDLYVDKTGQKIVPSKKPIENGETRDFIIHENEISTFLKKFAKKKGEYNVEWPDNKFAIKGSIDLSKILDYKFKNSDFTAPFSRLFFKMIIEYISYKFGVEVALLKKYDPIRELALKRRDKYETSYKLKFYNPQPYDIDKMNCVRHEIGIKYDKEIENWFFYFIFYGFFEYNFLIPYDNSYKEVSDCIQIHRYQKK